MRPSLRLVGTVVGTALIGAAAAGCGSSAPAAPRAASVSVSVPVNGAVLFVPRVKLVGTAAAGVQRIRVADHHVRVRHGGFAVSVRLRPGRNRIRILAAAPGLVPTRSWVMVRYLGRGPSLADRVNGTCTAYVDKMYLLATPTTQAQARTEFRRVATLVDAEVARFRTFTAPARERAAYGNFLAVEANAATHLHELLNSTSPASARQLLKTTIALVKERDRIGTSLGFFQCLSLLRQLSQLQG
jgi:hypothetical protein